MDSGDYSGRAQEFIDFELEVREGGTRDYTVAVLRSPAGEAQEEMSFPFSEWELKYRLQVLQNALYPPGEKRRRIYSQELQTVRDFGRGLFESFLAGSVGACYAVSRDRAKQQRKGLRIKLRVQPPKLAQLPWEFLYDPGRNEYPCLSSDTPLIRYVDLDQPPEPLTVVPPLKILGMVASPRGLEPLNVEHEKQHVEEAIEDLRAQGQVDLTWLEGQTWRDSKRAMKRGPWHVFHFIGHGGFDVDRDEGVIALADRQGEKHLLYAEDLAQVLKSHHDLRLVLLNSCEGARGSEFDTFSSVAATLVRPGIPAVVAMQYEITDKVAIEFSRSFYEAVADGEPVDAAVADARHAIKVEIKDSLEWGTPVLYMRSPDGRIFDIPTTPPLPPSLPPPSSTPPPPSAPPVTPKLKGALILLVDDNPDSVSYIAQTLRNRGAKVDMARTTHEALSYMMHRFYDVVISDMQRDGIKDEGERFLSECIARGIDRPTIFFVALLDPDRGIPPHAFGITNRTDELLDLVVKAWERARPST